MEYTLSNNLRKISFFWDSMMDIWISWTLDPPATFVFIKKFQGQIINNCVVQFIKLKIIKGLLRIIMILMGNT